MNKWICKNTVFHLEAAHNKRYLKEICNEVNSGGAFLINIRLGLRCLEVRNALGYGTVILITTIKMFCHIDPWSQCYKTFIYCHATVKPSFCVVKQNYWGIYRDIWNDICLKWHWFKMILVQNDICLKWLVQNDIASKWYLLEMTLVQNDICWSDICSKWYLF